MINCLERKLGVEAEIEREQNVAEAGAVFVRFDVDVRGSRVIEGAATSDLFEFGRSS